MNLQNLTIDEFEELVREMSQEERDVHRSQLSPEEKEKWDAMMQRVNDRLVGEIRGIHQAAEYVEQGSQNALSGRLGL